jgi:UDP-N-acetyl-D-mannosaminuronic acid transferase (WecB/TagA/CpsF family)
MTTVATKPHRVPVAPAPPKVVWPKKFDLFGVQVSATNYDELVDVILRAASQRASAVVSLHAVHAIVESLRDEVLRAKVNRFAAVGTDGHPVRWAMNHLHRAGLRDRVYGPELMLRLCSRAAAESPPFRPLTPDEDADVVRRINTSGARIVFIGLGCPKQDHFAADHAESIRAVQVCVGAAFEFHAGTKPMAPGWLQRYGLEWLYRLISEPRRLWRRYLTTNSIFLCKWLKATLHKSLRTARDLRVAGSVHDASGEA